MPEPFHKTPARDPRREAAELPLNDPRRATRRRVRRLFHCRLAPAAGGPDLAAMIVDCSPLAVLLMASGRLAAGEAAVVRVARAGSKRPALDLPVRVAHCADKAPGWFTVTARFAPPLTDEEARSLLTRLGSAPGTGR